MQRQTNQYDDSSSANMMTSESSRRITNQYGVASLETSNYTYGHTLTTVSLIRGVNGTDNIRSY